jgi:methylmalonyl-CoA mutase C-terminal domain/subunit
MAEATGGRRRRVLIAKPGLDGHDRGAKVIAYGLRDAGFEVIYTGLHQTPEQIADIALEEDADVIGLSILSGAHLSLSRRLMACLRDRGIDDRMVLVGGLIPEEDIPRLKELGITEVFVSGTSLASITACIDECLEKRGIQGK